MASQRNFASRLHSQSLTCLENLLLLITDESITWCKYLPIALSVDIIEASNADISNLLHAKLLSAAQNGTETSLYWQR